MVTAIVAVVGTFLVALVGVIGNRLDTNDRRKRLRQDVDLAKDLPAHSLSKTLLEHHVEWSIRQLMVRDRQNENNRQFAWSMFWWFFNLAAAIGSLLAAASLHAGPVRGALWGFGGAAVLLLIAQLVYWVRAARAVDKVDSATDTETDRESSAADVGSEHGDSPQS